MKPARKILSGLLAAVLVAQTGVIGAWAADGCIDASGATVADHGKVGRNVTTATACDATPHWLGNGTILMGAGQGTNYYYVKGGETVTCNPTATNIIVVETPFTGTVNVNAFASGNDKIYVLGTGNSPNVVENSTVTVDSMIFNFSSSTVKNTDVSTQAATKLTISAPTGGTVNKDGSLSPLSVTVQGSIGNPSYQWQSSATQDGSWQNISSATNSTYAAPTSTIGTTYYRCVVSDPRGKLPPLPPLPSPSRGAM